MSGTIVVILVFAIPTAGVLLAYYGTDKAMKMMAARRQRE